MTKILKDIRKLIETCPSKTLILLENRWIRNEENNEEGIVYPKNYKEERKQINDTLKALKENQYEDDGRLTVDYMKLEEVKLIRENRIEECFELLTISPTKEIIILQYQFSKNESDNRFGLLTYDFYQRIHDQIVVTLLDIIEEQQKGVEQLVLVKNKEIDLLSHDAMCSFWQSINHKVQDDRLLELYDRWYQLEDDIHLEVISYTDYEEKSIAFISQIIDRVYELIEMGVLSNDTSEPTEELKEDQFKDLKREAMELLMDAKMRECFDFLKKHEVFQKPAFVVLEKRFEQIEQVKEIPNVEEHNITHNKITDALIYFINKQ